ncbi:MAG TPA: hypothetical protein VHC90_05660 [Bryobacteraceae bacterium]|nr:hypothetical protein [Bryobacteraceae bacterium]
MAEDESPKPDPEHLARFRKVMTALVAVPKNEVIDALVKKHGNKPMKLDRKGNVVPVGKKRKA